MLFVVGGLDYICGMFGLWKRLKGADASTDATDAYAAGRLGAAALLIALARADDDYADAEKERILIALRGLFEFDESEALALRSEAETAEAEAMDIQRFTHAVKSAYTPDERAIYLEAAWRVVLADDKRDPEENTLMRRLAGLLGVEDRVSVEARQRAQAANDAEKG